MVLPAQRSFDDLGVPLSEVPFCVLDLETTGGSPSGCGITEIGALRFRGGEPDGEFHSLVNPHQEIPAFITILTGITQAMVIAAPPIDEVFPAFLEFLRGDVVVGHNVRFDLSFLNAAAERLGYGHLPNRSVDTHALARRLVRGELRDLRLGSLAAHLGSPVTPNHRALEDARATAYVLWGLLERAGTLGITHLEDLMQLPTARGAPHYGKIRLADSLPRRPGVYLFRDKAGEVFYVGKAANLRTRVRAYFYGDDRRQADQMLRELAAIEHRVCANDLEAEVTELRLILAHNPRHNRRSRPGPSPHWLRLTDEAFPRLSLVRSPHGPGLLHLGPFRGQAPARLVAEAIWDALPVRRCSGPAGRRQAPCAPAQLGVAFCPCDGHLDATTYRPVVERLIEGVEHRPDLLLEPLADRVAALARDSRFEEAAWVRDRHHALARALERRRAWRALTGAGLLSVEHPQAGGALIERGRLVAAWGPETRAALLPLPACGDDPVSEAPPDLGDAEEAEILWRWLGRSGIRLLEASGGLALPARPVRRLEKVEV